TFADGSGETFSVSEDQGMLERTVWIDERGTISIECLGPGEVTIEVGAKGYPKPVTKKVTVVKDTPLLLKYTFEKE
ncbi:MAG: hypothetical protein ACYTHM_15970, partial [Planctomycetota bacterium]